MDKKERPKFTTIVNAKPRKIGFGEKLVKMFVPYDRESMKEYVIYDILVPSVKDLISDTINAFMYGGKVRSRGSSRMVSSIGNSIINYSGLSTKVSGRRPLESRSSRNVDEFFIPRYDENGNSNDKKVDDIRNQLLDTLSMFPDISVAEYYTIIGIKPESTDEKWGWDDLSRMYVTTTPEGWIINMPTPKALN